LCEPLLFRGKIMTLVEVKLFLRILGLLLTWLGNRADKLGVSPGLDNSLCWLSLSVEFPVTAGIFVRRVKNGMFKKMIGRHAVPIIFLFSN
jgi:hypothetical protein